MQADKKSNSQVRKLAAIAALALPVGAVALALAFAYPSYGSTRCPSGYGRLMPTGCWRLIPSSVTAHGVRYVLPSSPVPAGFPPLAAGAIGAVAGIVVVVSIRRLKARHRNQCPNRADALDLLACQVLIGVFVGFGIWLGHVLGVGASQSPTTMPWESSWSLAGALLAPVLAAGWLGITLVYMFAQPPSGVTGHDNQGEERRLPTS